jgi:hypothetical protein
MVSGYKGRRTDGRAEAEEDEREGGRDEDCQLRHGGAAGIDVAEAEAVVCLRLPPGEGRKRRTSAVWTVTAAVPAIEALAGGLKAAGVELASMEPTSDYGRGEGA